MRIKFHGIKIFLSVLLCCIIGVCSGVANDLRSLSRVIRNEKKDTLEIYFRQGYSLWEPNFKNNGKRMKDFVERIKEIQMDTSVYRVSKIHIVSGASPEGRYKLNKRLSANRAKRIRKVLKSYISLPDTMIVEDSRGVNWKGLEELVLANDVPYKDEVLDIIRNTPEIKYGREARKLQLAYLRNGKPWRYMFKNLFPKLRSFNLQIVIEWEKLVAVEPEAIPAKKIEVKTLDKVPLKETEFNPPVIKQNPLYMALKTNLLYDALLVPNIGIEFWLGNGYSITGNWMYSWWHSRSWDWWHRTYGGNIEIRKYFGEKAAIKPLQGWHVGIYGQMLTYDFELGGRGYLGDRWTWGGGVSLGYSKPISRHLNLDFTLGLGYLGGKYKEYLPMDDCYVWQSTKDRNWFGPTNAEVTLVWLLGRGNCNK